MARMGQDNDVKRGTEAEGNNGQGQSENERDKVNESGAVDVEKESTPIGENVKEENGREESVEKRGTGSGKEERTGAERLEDAIERLTETIEKVNKTSEMVNKSRDEKIKRLEEELNEYSKNVGRRLTPYRVEDYYNYNSKLNEFNDSESQKAFNKSKEIWDRFEI